MNTDQKDQFIPKKPFLQLFILSLLFLAAFGIRLFHINDPPLDFHPGRQYHSATHARGYYFESLESIPEWRRHVARINQQIQERLEPPLMEFAAVFAYKILGGEYLWIPRMLSSIFWLIGGFFLYLLIKKIISADAALFSTAFYLFLPYGISASRSFQPDPMMVMMMIICLYCLFRYFKQPTLQRLLIAAIVSALAIFIKFVCVFIIFGVFISIGMYKHGSWKWIIKRDLLIFIFVSLLPGAIYYINGIYIAGFLKAHIPGRFFPHLLLSPLFWMKWLNLIGRVVGFPAFIGALLGTLMFRDKLSRAFIMGSWVGYFLFGLIFNYHIHTHDYYHLPLIPIVAISLGQIGALIMSSLKRVCTNWQTHLIAWAILFLPVIISIGQSGVKLIQSNFGSEVKTAKEIGDLLGHSVETIFLDRAYGVALKYHGELGGVFWPSTADLQYYEMIGMPEFNVIKYFKNLELKRSAEYFIVTDFKEFEEQSELKNYLYRNFPLLAKNEDYLIFDLRKKVGAEKPPNYFD